MGRAFPYAFLAVTGFTLVACDEGGRVDAGRGSPPPQSPVTGYPVFHSDEAESYRLSPEFLRSDPGEAEENHIRLQFGEKPLCATSTNPGCAGSSAYALQNIHIAHTATRQDGEPLVGLGQTIAVVDNGFRFTHQELAGKEIIRHTAPGRTIGRDSHGTAVAAIAAGQADELGMMGIAPAARLHVASWRDVFDSDLLAHLSMATRDARDHGAVVQNNSWGWESEKRADNEVDDFAGSGETDYANHLAMRQGGDPGEWRELFNAYNAFQQGGVIVFANSNNRGLGDSAAWASLPDFLPELSEAWIAVGNALFSVDDAGAILEADLLSAPCGSAARYCVVADGTLRIPTDAADTAYTLGTGTSYAAPQVAGEIAILAQAFPDLSPAEWTTRLLATARRDWTGFQDSVSGHSDFAPGVRRAYSRLYGHGVPDMKAALSPVGGLAIASGENVFTGPRTPLGAAVTGTPPIIGNAISKALSSRLLMAVDALGGDFYLDGARFASESEGPTSAGSGFAKQLMAEQEKLGFAFANMPYPALQKLRDTASVKLLFSQGFTEFENGLAFSRLMPIGRDAHLQFAGSMTETSAGEAMQFAISRLTRRRGLVSELTVSAGHARGGLFGLQTESPFAMAQSNGRLSAGLTLSAPLGYRWSLSGYGEFGVAHAREAPWTLVDYGALTYASGGVVLDKAGLVTPVDNARLYAGMKPKALTGHAALRLPVGRSKMGAITYEVADVDLAEGDFPVRFGFSYTQRTRNDFDLRVNANMDFFAAAPENGVADFAVSLSKAF
ncbi:S8 family peptidase [uncultured Nitratireductor sp.]|uniref:S8 family peptidase n=1 Tax=uncultured Nitratireductor sp. TaxID=520953 RepID=UPI0025FBCF7D|nr:S8 family peptidase [uncultured Nitratireductor sp.]